MRENWNDVDSIDQFIMTEDELDDLYSSINFAVGNHTTRTQLKLSKPEKSQLTANQVFDDCYLFSIQTNLLATLISEISADRNRLQASTIVISCLERGRKLRD